MLTSGYLPLLETVTWLTFSLQMKILNAGRDGAHRPLVSSSVSLQENTKPPVSPVQPFEN